MKKLRLFLISFIPLLLAALSILFYQTQVVRNLYRVDPAFLNVDNLQNFLLKREFLVTIIMIVFFSLVQFGLFILFFRPVKGHFITGIQERLSGIEDGEKESRILYNRIIELYKSVILDEDTGAVVYKHFLSMLEKELVRAVRYSVPFSILKVSVNNKDNFDSVFRKVGSNILSVLRNVDIVSVDKNREFVTLLPHTKKYNAERAAQRIFARMGTLSGMIGQKVDISIGIASFSDDGTTMKEIMDKAEDNLKRARMLGPNKVIF